MNAVPSKGTSTYSPVALLLRPSNIANCYKCNVDRDPLTLERERGPGVLVQKILLSWTGPTIQEKIIPAQDLKTDIGVLVLWCITLSKADNDKSVNIKVGFDLEPSEDEAPAPKNKKDDDSDSSASSEEPAKLRKKEPAPISKEDKIGSDDRDEGSDLENGRASTKGLRVDEYEPEENGKVHRSYKDSSE